VTNRGYSCFPIRNFVQKRPFPPINRHPNSLENHWERSISRTTKRRLMSAQVDRPTNVERFNANHTNMHTSSLNLQAEFSRNHELDTKRQAGRSI